MSPRALKGTAAIAAVVAAYLFLSSPGKVVLTPSGEVEGLANHARDSLQGRRFWHDQSQAASKELQDLWAQPDRNAAVRRESDKFALEERQAMEDLYRKFPEMRPSPAERRVESLRDAADRVEQAELDRFLEEYRLKRIAELQALIPIAQQRAQ